MGGTSGEIRGNSKINVYLDYREMTDDCMFETKIPDPKYKKRCKSLMELDSETEEWVLHYYLHT